MRRSSIVLLFIALAAPLFAAPFTITVPNRVTGGELMPTGRVKMTLETNANTAGSTVTIEGVNVPLGGGFTPLNNAKPGDPTSFDVAKASTDAADNTKLVLEIVLRHVMDDPANFCKLEDNPAPPANWVYNLDVTTPGAVQGYRLSSYGAAGLVSSSNPTNCTVTKRRIFSTPAITSLVATNRGRHAQDIVLVLDNSGSMDWDTPGSPGERRMDVLDASASMFLALWETEGLDPLTGTGGTGLANDRMGLVWFSTDLTLPFPDGATKTALTTRGPMTGPGGGHPWNGIGDSITSMAPTLNTAIGKGLQAGLDSLAASSNDSAIVLMTDGLQNVAPLVERVGVDPNATVRIAGGPDLASFGIPILTVSLGIPGGVDPALFDDVARKTAGRSRLTATSIGTASAFAGTLVSALLGDTLLVATEGTDSVAAGAPGATPVSIPLDGSIRRVAFAVSWPTTVRNALDLEIRPPGAADPIAPVTRANGANWLVYSADIPSSGTAGDWNVRVVRRANAGTGQSSAIPYYFAAYTYEGKLDFEGVLPPEVLRTGDQVTVRTEVGFDKQPVTTADGRIRLRVARPGESIGNLLHDLQVSPGVLETELPGGDPTSRYQRKLTNLTPAILSQVEPALLPGEIPMRHEGNGLYSATFSDTSEAGQYKFLLTYDFDAPHGSGRIRRVEQLERDVKVKPDPVQTNVDLKPVDPAGTWTVLVTPKDRFGNYVGPGYPERVNVTVNGPGTVTGIRDVNETGDYEVTITGVPPGTTPDVAVKVDDVTMPVDGGSSGKWRFFVDAGLNSPDSGLDGSLSINAGIERILTPHWSIEGILGYHTFDGPFVDPDGWQLSANAKYFFGSGAFRPFLNGGVGVYRIDPPNDTSFGINVGGGLLYELSSKWAVEGVYNYHSTDPLDWSTLQLGLRWHF